MKQHAGGKNSFKERGIIPRVIIQCFQDIKAFSTKQAVVKVSYLEVYNEMFFDLLDPTTESASISVCERNGSIDVKGIRHTIVNNEAAALQLLFEGEAARMVGSHQLNRESSRSHSIFCLEIEVKNDPNDAQVCCFRLDGPSSV